MIPNIFHFVYLNLPEFKGRPFGLLDYLSIKSALLVNKPEQINLYYNVEQDSEWWEKIKPFVNMVKIEAPTEIFGQKIYHIAHVADVVRMQILLEQGGIYIDTDVICKKPFTPFLSQEFVIGKQGYPGFGTEKLPQDEELNVVRQEGLCIGVMMSAKGAFFLDKWIEGYDPKRSLWQGFRSRGYDEYYGEMSISYPAHLATLHPDKLTVAAWDAFHYPLYTPEQINQMFETNEDKWPNAYAHHLWNSSPWHQHLQNLSLEMIAKEDNYFCQLVRPFV